MAGLWAFPLFFAALLPRRGIAIYVITAGLFSVWKSELSQPLIDAWNSAGLLRLARVADPTDLVTLAVLPLSFVYLQRCIGAMPRQGRQFAARRSLPAVMLISIFAFAATSSLATEIYVVSFDESTGDNVFLFDQAPPEVITTMKTMKLLKKEPFLGLYSVNLKSDLCSTDADMRFNIDDAGGGRSKIVLREARHHCPDKLKKADLLELFKTALVDKLHPAVPSG